MPDRPPLATHQLIGRSALTTTSSDPAMARATSFLTCACLAATAACFCNDIGCPGGLWWTATPRSGEPVQSGAYSFEITLEDDVFTVDCIIAASYAESSCAAPVHVLGTTDYSVDLRLQPIDYDNWTSMSPIGGFFLSAADFSGSDPSGRYSVARGPTAVSIVVTFDDAPLTSVDYEIEYVRNHDYRGHPSCGFCDEPQAREHQW